MAIDPGFGRFTPRIIWPVDPAEYGVVPPPHGFSSWADYFAGIARGRADMIFASPGTIPKGRKATVVWTRTGEDVATIGLHFVAVDGTDVVDFTDANCAELEGRINDLWAAIKNDYPSSLNQERVVWHEFGVGVRRPNPMVREFAMGSNPGTQDPDDQLPPQVAVSVTLKTTRRRTWGRVYLPAPIVSTCVAGRLTEAIAMQFRNAFGNLLDGAATDNLPLVIWSPRHGGDALTYGEAAHAAGDDNPDTSSFAITVDQVQVDDLFDVIESRRFDKALLRETHTLGG